MAAIVKGSKVRIKRKYSYWYNEVGVVASREKEPTKSRYPITVRFEKCNYYGLQGVDGGNTTNNFSEEELELVMSWSFRDFSVKDYRPCAPALPFYLEGSAALAFIPMTFGPEAWGK